ncbi:SWIB/MDM2 domain-containing protein [Crocinitomicaceae bacterium]|nr:SWIB/MDM2 domain-containing protein [Crocinitomicaceae bacterium]
MPKVKKATKAKKTSSKSKKTASKETTVPEVVATPVAEVAAVPATDTPSVPTLTESFGELLGQLQALRSQLTSVTGQVRALQKRADRELKNAHKASKKRQKRTGNRAPSGFVKPTKISTELANFLGKPKGTEMARTEVTREINKYIRANKLQDKDNGRIILADTKLRKLLKLKKDDELTYFNLQRYMSPHFAKNVKKVVASE